MHTYIFTNLNNYTLTTKRDILINPNLVTSALIISLKKRGMSSLVETLYKLHDVRYCGFCGAKMHTTQFEFLYDVADNNMVTIRSGGSKKDKPYGKYYACIEKDCSRHGLNPNSVEFVSKAFNVSLDDALSIIHKRNASPFYVTNYNSIDDYIEYQSHSYMSSEQRDLANIQRQETYYKNKEAYISKYGIAAWDDFNKRKNTTSFDYFLKKHNNNYEIATIEFNKRIKLIIPERPKFDAPYDKILKWWNGNYGGLCKTKEEFYTECTDRLSKKGIIGKCLFINGLYDVINNKGEFKKDQYFFWIGSIIFEVQDFFDFLHIQKEVIHVINKFSTKMYSYSHVVDGFCFRSDMEYTFYTKIKGLPNVVVLGTNQRYPTLSNNGKLRFYDFKIECNNKIYYIELCSNIDNEYIHNQLIKQESFGSICIIPKFIDKFIDDIKNNREINIKGYYEYSLSDTV